MRKKKTYVFTKNVLENLKEIKEITQQSETQIISDALSYYLHHIKKQEELISKLDFILEKIEKLSLELGRCQERVRYLEDRVKDSKGKNS